MKLRVDSDFENVLIFVSDAMRYDKADAAFDDKTVYKSISSGLSSPAGFASILTGLYPSHHGVTSFEDRMDSSLATLFDLRPNKSFYNEGKELGSVLDTSNTIPHNPLQELDDSFIYFERDLIPHAPFNYAEDEYTGSVKEYCKERRGHIVEDYDNSVTSSVAKFKNRVETLRDKGILEETLVIFTADHGELLGEYGRYGHGSPTCPELAYVPIVFYNQDVSFEHEETVAQVDILPTLEAIFGEDVTDSSYPGFNLQNSTLTDRMILNQRSDEEWSVWDRQGGYIFSYQNLLYRIGWWGVQLTRNPYAPLQRRHSRELIRTALRGYRSEFVKVGTPSFAPSDASAFAEEQFQEGEELGKIAESRSNIDTEHLEALGYLE